MIFHPPLKVGKLTFANCKQALIQPRVTRPETDKIPSQTSCVEPPSSARSLARSLFLSLSPSMYQFQGLAPEHTNMKSNYRRIVLSGGLLINFFRVLTILQKDRMRLRPCGSCNCPIKPWFPNPRLPLITCITSPPKV